MSLTASSRTAVVAEDLRDRGFTLDTDGWATVARGGPTGLAGVDAPLAVISPVNSNPLTVVSAVANAAEDGHVPILVADPQIENGIESILSEPFLLEGQQAGGRSFFPIEDRIRLPDGSYACVGTSGQIEWFETSRKATDDPPLVLEVGGETVAVLDSVDGLACPGPSVSTFQYRYARGEDGQFRVSDEDNVVGRYTGVSAMRADGFRPLPLPLVPEHHVRDHGRLARATVVASVDSADRTVAYRSRSSV